MIHWKNRRASTPMHWLTASQPTGPLSQRPPRSLPCQAATGQPTRPPPHRPPPHRPTRPPHATGQLQHHQTLAPKMPRRHKQTGLDAKGVTPELLRLKFYCSWTRDFFFLFPYFFLFFKCLCCLMFNYPPSFPVDFFGFPFFFFLFLLSPSFLVLLVLLL
jgi:hypothetical protein